MDIKTYLAHIRFFQTPKPDAKTLRGLQVAHMRSVPFENLDIGLIRTIRINE